MKNIYKTLQACSFVSISLVLFSFPSSTNYQLKSYEFGGGGGISGSSNYESETFVGDVAGIQSGSNYSIKAGLLYTQQANVPPAPTLQNSGSWYNKLQIILNNGNNPTDATFAVAISTDNFATTQYVQSDNTVGGTLGMEDYRTYASWGSGSGTEIIGLTYGTTYYVKVRASQGIFTESPWGPIAFAATVDPSLDFDIDVSATDSETAAPYTVGLGTLSAGAVQTASDSIWVDIDTNAASGGYVYVFSENGGLKSDTLNYTITSTSTNLTSATEGFGLRGNTDTETSGGPLTFLGPYNVTADNVGVVDTTIREIISTSGNPIIGGRGSVLLKAKVSNTTPSSNDYIDILTLVAAGTF